ncbi:hypothetical protein GQ44DRAFT_291946 [Phaeosphaeriaceae sp. PMI808]|nr:hypothetical protein GQ44DRAFT_291946 [Phaeosphaeriaceae sp. PMI808]
MAARLKREEDRRKGDGDSYLDSSGGGGADADADGTVCVPTTYPCARDLTERMDLDTYLATVGIMYEVQMQSAEMQCVQHNLLGTRGLGRHAKAQKGKASSLTTTHFNWSMVALPSHKVKPTKALPPRVSPGQAGLAYFMATAWAWRNDPKQGSAGSFDAFLLFGQTGKKSLVSFTRPTA